MVGGGVRVRVEKVRLKLTSAKVEVKVEVKAELGKNKHLFNFMHHIKAKFSKDKIWAFFSWNFEFRMKNVFFQLWYETVLPMSRFNCGSRKNF